MRLLFHHPFEGVDLESASQAVKEELQEIEADRESAKRGEGFVLWTMEYERSQRLTRLLKDLKNAQRLGVPSTIELWKTTGWLLLICFLFAFGYGSTPVKSPSFLALLVVLLPGFTWALTGYSRYRSVGADLSVAVAAGLFLGLVAARVVRPDASALRPVIMGTWFVGFLFAMIQGLDCRSQYSAQDFEELKREQQERRVFAERIRYVSELPEEEREEKAREVMFALEEKLDALMSEINRPWWQTSQTSSLQPIRMWPVWVWVLTIPLAFYNRR